MCSLDDIYRIITIVMCDIWAVISTENVELWSRTKGSKESERETRLLTWSNSYTKFRHELLVSYISRIENPDHQISINALWNSKMGFTKTRSVYPRQVENIHCHSNSYHIFGLHGHER